MKRKIIGALFLTAALAFTVGGFAACDSGSAASGQVQISGFEVQEEITVNSGSVVRPESVFVTDSEGNFLDIWVEVTDSNGAIVGLNANAFNADDAKGYTITYVVRASDNKTYRKQTRVKVLGGDTGLTLSVDYDKEITVGEETLIVPVCSDENAVIEYSVKRGETEYAVTDGAFTPDTYGKYTVLVEATAGALTAEYQYEVFARTVAPKGAIEVYDDEWTAYAEFIGDTRTNNWSVIDSATSGLKDRNGMDDTFLYYQTSDEYLRHFLLPRNDKAYYETLAAEGYEYVSTWIYIDGEVDHITQLSMDYSTNSFYKFAGPNLKGGEWTQITYRLADIGTQDWTRSFISGYDYFKDFSTYFVLIDNSTDWNTAGGHEDDIGIYISDFYAVKGEEISLKTDAKIGYDIGDSWTATDLFDADMVSDLDLIFTITQGDETKILTDGFVFDKNSSYTVNVYTGRGDVALSGDTAVEIGSTYKVNSEKNSVSVSSGVALDLVTELGLSVPNETVTDWTFESDDPELSFNGTEVTAAFAGDYTIRLTEMVLGGETVKVTKTIEYSVTATGYSVAAERYDQVYDNRVTDSVNLLGLGTAEPENIPTGYSVGYKLFAVVGAEEKEISATWTDSTLDLTDLSGKFVAKAVVEKGDAYAPFIELDLEVYGNGMYYASKYAPVLGSPANGYETFDGITNSYLGDYDGKTNVMKINVKNHDSMGIAFDPAFSLDVLNTLYQSGEGYYALFRFKVENVSSKGKSSYSGYDVGSGKMNGITVGEWHTVKMNLLDAMYQGSADNYQGRYDFSVANYLRAQAQGKVTETLYKGFLVRFNDFAKNEVNVYVTTPELLKTDKSERLVDLNEGSGGTFDLASLVDVSVYDSSYKIEWTLDETAITDGKVDTSTLSNGAHTLKLVVTGTRYAGNYILMRPTTVFNGKINVYNSAQGIVWRTEVSTSNAKVFNYTKAQACLSVVDASEVPAQSGYAATGKYYKVSQEKIDVLSLWVKPEYGLDYYKELKSKGYTAITFDYYVSASPNGVDLLCWNGKGSETMMGKTGEWATAELSLDTVIQDWYYLSSGSYKEPDGSYGSYGYLRSCIFTVADWNAEKDGKYSLVEFYVGNFGSK